MSVFPSLTCVVIRLLKLVSESTIIFPILNRLLSLYSKARILGFSPAIKELSVRFVMSAFACCLTSLTYPWGMPVSRVNFWACSSQFNIFSACCRAASLIPYGIFLFYPQTIFCSYGLSVDACTALLWLIRSVGMPLLYSWRQAGYEKRWENQWKHDIFKRYIRGVTSDDP